jgi:hypothetical protein
MNYVPKNGMFNIIGVQEIDEFSIDYKGVQRKFVMLPEMHSTLKFECEDADDCKSVAAEIKSQIKKIWALSEATNAVGYVSKYMSEEDISNNKKRFEDAVEDLVNVDDGVSNCVLISTYLMQLARNATTCIDIYVETKAAYRGGMVRKSDSFLQLVGSMFSLCDKSAKNIELCADTFPNARFHGLEYRDGGFPAYYEQVPITVEGTDRELLLRAIEDAIDGKDAPYEEFGKRFHAMIGKQFTKSSFTRAEFLNAFMRTWDELPKIMTNVTSRSFRLSARLFDAYTILRIMNTSWGGDKTTRGSTGCRGKASKNIIYFAGAGHTMFLRGFLERLPGLTIENGFNAVRRMENVAFNPLATSHQRNYACLKIPHDKLPFIDNMLFNDRYIFDHATNRQLLDYMKAFDLSDLEPSWWESRIPDISNPHGFNPMWVFLITQPYLNSDVTPTYPTHPRQLKFNAFGGVDDSILRNMLLMQVVGTVLASIVPTDWREVINEHTIATNVVQAQMLQIATSRTVPDLLQNMSKAEHDSGKRWTARFVSTVPVSLSQYSNNNRRHDVFEGVKFLFNAGPIANKNWALWCGRLFVSVVRSLE